MGNVLAAARAAMHGKLSGSSAARFHTRWETHAMQLAEELAAEIWPPGRYTYFDNRHFLPIARSIPKNPRFVGRGVYDITNGCS